MNRRRKATPASQEELSSLGQITGELLHDLANEMTVLQGWALLARGEQEAGRHSGAEIERVLEITSEMGSMLRDVLETIAGQRGSPDAGFDPVRLTEQTLAQWVRELAGITVRMQSTLRSPIRLPGRASFWSRSLRNLLGNAGRYARSEIAITLREERGPAGAEIVLRVENDGRPIPPDARGTLFEPLKRGGDGRYGLGLSSAAWAVRQLGGSIACVACEQLGGAAFEIRIPAPDRSGTAAAGDATEAGSGGVLQGARLVLLEHDPLSRRDQMRLLRRLGAEVLVLTAEHDPEELLVSRIEGALPHLILLDLHDPARDGLALWNRLCVECPHLAERVAFTVAESRRERGRQLSELTGQPYLAKPLDPAHLVELAEEFRLGG